MAELKACRIIKCPVFSVELVTSVQSRPPRDTFKTKVRNVRTVNAGDTFVVFSKLLNENKQFYEDDDDGVYDDAEISYLAAVKVVFRFMVLSITSNSLYSGWFLDSGASRHMFSQRQMFACLRRSSL